ncbi:MAG: hypothetical protein F6K36_13435 [Symploca sp. SIO3C6]|nr:hypothetical protein [Symploca sp. SIO3C6]
MQKLKTVEKVKRVWQLLNTDIRELGTPGERVEAGAEVSKASLELMIHLGLLGTPLAPVAAVAAGLSFVGLSRKGLNLLRDKTEDRPTLEQWVAIAFPLAYIQSFDSLVENNNWLREKIGAGVSDKDAKQQVDQLGELELDQALIEEAFTYFPESKLAQALNQQLSLYLEQKGLDRYTIPLVTGWVAWGTYPHIDSLLSYESKTIVKPLSVTRAAAKETAATGKYGNIESYLTEQISPNSSNPLRIQQWKVLGEEFKIPDIYVPLNAQLLDSNGKVKEKANSVNLESWAKEQLSNPGKNGQVMFIQAGPGRGKSVFCRMFADWVRQHLHPIWTPILIRLRDIHAFEENIENTLRAAVQEDFAKSDNGWLTDSNTRFLFLLDGFDELRMQGRTSGGIEDFLKKVGYFQSSCQQNPQLGHRFLVTGRELALQGIVVPGNLERVQIELMDEKLQQQWLSNWGKFVGSDKATRFQEFLQAQNCPLRVKQLAQEPLLLYLLAAMHRDGELEAGMFEKASSTNAKILIYQKALDWVLTKQRPQELNFELTEQETEDLKRILMEAGLCVTQAGGEWASINMIEERLKGDDAAKELLEKAQQRIGENPLRNALAAFYLRPASASGIKEGAVEFVHKSFGEFLCALRFQESLQEWVLVESRRRRRGFIVSREQLAEEIYDLLGYGGLTREIVDYLMALLDLSNEELVQLFQRLEEFYLDWCNGEFIDNLEETTLPQKTGQKLRKYGVELGQRRVDINVGLNVMILLLELHRYAQENNELKDKIAFHPCGKKNTEYFDSERLLRIISYSNSVDFHSFRNTVGPFLSGAFLSGAFLSGADLRRAGFSGADLRGADLRGADFSGTDLRGVDFSGAYLSGAYFENITWDEDTKWEDVRGLKEAINVPEALKQQLSISQPAEGSIDD